MKEKCALIFGHTGQDGWYMRELLEKLGVRVFGISRSEQQLPCSLTDFDSLKSVIEHIRPYFIFNFAASSTTKHEALFENHATISTGTCNLLEAVRSSSPSTKVFLSGSALQFQNNGMPINEDTPFTALSPYAVERNYTTYLARYYRAAFSMKIYFGYFFTHDSPRRKPQHMTKKIALAAKQAKEGLLSKLRVGDIDVRKEYLYAGDAMTAVWLLMQQENFFEAVIGNGEDHSIAEWLEACFSRVDLDWRNYVVIENDFVPEYRRLVSDPARLRSLGFHPQVSFIDLADRMMECL